MLVNKELKDCLFLLMIMRKVVIKLQKTLTEDISFQEEKLKIIIYEIDGRNFYDQLINDLIKQYDKVRKISTGQSDDYTTCCLLDFAYFKKNYRLIAVDLGKQKALDADSRAIQQIFFTGKASEDVVVYYILEQSKKTILQFSKGTTNVS